MPHPHTHPQPTAGALLLTALCLLALLAPFSASAAERVGRVLIASGDVTAQREGAPTRGLGRQDPIYAQDTIETGTDGRIQIQFSDAGMVDLQPASRFRIAEYELEDDGGGSAVMEFLRGALRTVTGSIGDNEDDEYRMDTPVATIGIRGTAYALHYCDAACADAGGQLGLYGRVDNGEITVGSGSDTITLGAGQFFFVPEDDSPRRIVAPPEGILDRNGESGNGGSGDDGTAPAAGDVSPPEAEPGVALTDDTSDPLDPTFESSEIANLRPGVTGNVVFGGAFLANGTGDTALLISPEDADVRFQDGAVIGSEFPIGFVDASAATLAEQGTANIGALSIPWGRWEGNLNAGGDAATGSFAFVYTEADDLTPSSIVSGLDTGYSGKIDPDFDYGPLAIASNGDLWNLNGFNLRIDVPNDLASLTTFSLQRLSDGSPLRLDTTSVLGSINTARSSFNIDSLALGSGAWSGEMQGRFVGDSGQALVIGYELNENNGTNTIRGVAIVEEAF